MAVHLSDRALLQQMIDIGEAILSAPLMPAPTAVPLLSLLAADLSAAIRCPGHGIIGSAEVILITALRAIALGGTASTAALYGYALAAQNILPTVRDHLFAVVAAEHGARS